MSSQDQRRLFAERLAVAAASAKVQLSPTRFAEGFNAISDDSISIHAARKWIVGESIPAQNRLQVIAEWLGVRASWLRFGEGELGTESAVESRKINFSADELKVIADLRQLPAEEKKIVRELIGVLASSRRVLTRKPR